MAAKPTLESYLSLVQKSGLVEKPRLIAALEGLREKGERLRDAYQLAQLLVAAGLLTSWQAQTLLKGRYKGFHLGKYNLLDLLGSGGMGSVYLAEHVLMRRKVAIKVLPLKRVKRRAYLQRFYREARAVAQLDHPNIVRAYDVDQDGNVHFLVMEYVNGTSLFKLVKQQGPLDPRQAVQYVRQAAEGLLHAWEAGLVHRDIKPGNLLVDRRGTVKLLDLGLARFFEEEDDDPLTKYQKEAVLGTVDYLAPEQALNSHTVDVRADIYGLGCTMYFLLTGRPPFPHGTMAQRLLYHQTREPAPLRHLRPQVPQSLEALVAKMMAKDVKQRHQTPAELTAALDAWLDCAADPQGQGIAVPLRSGTPDDSAPNAATLLEGHETTVDRLRPDDATAAKTAKNGPHNVPDQETVSTLIARPSAGREQSDAALPGEDSSSAESGVQPDDALETFLAGLQQDSTAPTDRDATDSDAVEVESSVTPANTGEESVEPAWVEPDIPGGDEPSSDDQVKQDDAGTEAIGFSDSGSGDSGRPASDDTDIVTETVFNEERPWSPAQDDAGEAPVPPTTSGDMRAKAKTVAPRRRSWLTLSAGVAGVVALIVLLIKSSGSGEHGRQQPVADGAAREASAPQQLTGSGKLTLRKRAPGPRRSQVTVKPAGGDFATLVDALRAAEAGQRIVVAPGQVFDEQLSLTASFPENVTLEVQGGGRATIKHAQRSNPLLQLQGVKGFRMRGFDLQAGGRPVAVVLAGTLAGTRLSELTISGFAQAGIAGNGCRGTIRGEIVLDHLQFEQAGDQQAVGMLWTGAGAIAAQQESGVEKDSGVSRIKLRHCRFDRSMAQAVRFEVPAVSVEIDHCLMAVSGQGIVFGAGPAKWQAVALTNNTFFAMQQGIVFDQMPAPGSSNLSIRNNLFYDLTGPAGFVAQGYNDSRMVGTVLATNPPGAAYNWDNRPASESAEPPGTLPLFSIGGRRELLPGKLLSSDWTEPDFLRPPTGSPLGSSGAGGTLPRYVGALSPTGK